MSDERDAVVEAIARALCAADGMDWDEARSESGADGATTAMAYAVAADDALDAFLAHESAVAVMVEAGRLEQVRRITLQMGSEAISGPPPEPVYREVAPLPAEEDA